MRDDIYGGIKNALERGYTMEQAIQSFINAGYNDIEVRQAANQIAPGAIATAMPQGMSTQNPQANLQQPIQQQPSQAQLQQPPQAAAQMGQQQFKQLGAQKVKSKQVHAQTGTGKIIFLVFILIFLIGVLTSVVIFRDQVINFLTGLF